MTNMNDVVRVLKKERARLTNQLQGISAALSAFGAAYASSNGASRTISAAGNGRSCYEDWCRHVLPTRLSAI